MRVNSGFLIKKRWSCATDVMRHGSNRETKNCTIKREFSNEAYNFYLISSPFSPEWFNWSPLYFFLKDVICRTRTGMLLAWLFAGGHREVLLLIRVTRFRPAEICDNRRRHRIGRGGLGLDWRVGCITSKKNSVFILWYVHISACTLSFSPMTACFASVCCTTGFPMHSAI